MNARISPSDTQHILANTAELWDDVRGARLFITGGTGFVGSWLLEAFVAANAFYNLKARAVVLTRNPQKFRVEAAHLAESPAIMLHEGNATDFIVPDGTFDFVIHAATERYYPPDRARPLGILADDERATRRVLDLCSTSGARRMLFTSSGAVYGPQPRDRPRFAESDSDAPDPTDPRTVYGQSKRLSEFTCCAVGAQRGIAVTIARLFAFIGPGLPLDEDYAAGNFMRDVLSERSIAISGDGTAVRSYLYAADLAIWLWTILLRGSPGRAYNVGSPNEISILSLAEAVAAAAGMNAGIDVAKKPAPGALPARYVPSTARAESELGLRPLIGLEDGLRRTYHWHLANSNLMRTTLQR